MNIRRHTWSTWTAGNARNGTNARNSWTAWRRRARGLRTKSAGALASVVLAAAALAGCSAGSDSGSASSDSSSSASASAAAAVDGTRNAAAVLADNEETHAEDGETAYGEADESAAVAIELKGDSASADGKGVDVDGSTVTITAAGTYVLSGSLDDGQIVVTAPEATVKLVLDGVDISSSSGAAIAATEAERLVVVLADGSENKLSDTDSYAEDAEANAALYSAGDLTIGGEGSLTVRGNGNDAIAGKDGLVVEGGNITVEAADDGIRGKDYLVVHGGTVTVTAKGDGLKSDNADEADAGYIAVDGGTVSVTANGDAVDAATDLVVTGGELTVKADASDDTSAHGLKSGVITVLEGGTVDVDASADALHGDAAVHLNGAEVTLAAGDDGVHAEGDLVISGGTLDITGSNEGLEGKDILVRGGTSNVTSDDDGVNASGSEATSEEDADARGGRGGGMEVGDYTAKVTGGTLVLDSQGDGFDSNGTAEITGGTIVVNGPETGGNGALDVNGSFTVSGGTLLAAGSAGMVVAPDEESDQGWLSATLDASVEAGTTLHLVDADGEVVASYVTSKTIQNVVYAGAGIKSGEEYSVYAGGSTSGSDTGGLAGSGALGSAEKIATATAGEAPEGGFGGGPGGGGDRGQ
ncbi:carbohydrate-binding domain-containing protein [Streptomyces sp. NPDC014892]|uniref:carbohydrate-binding domain-containing protein n=1 Tax=Streptomyces sp. NPDC014892 TaxID=3364930 RepID=UPI0036FA7E30